MEGSALWLCLKENSYQMRVAMYQKMLRWIRSASPTVSVYLCMESKEVWEQVFGFVPSCEKEPGQHLTAQA